MRCSMRIGWVAVAVSLTAALQPAGAATTSTQTIGEGLQKMWRDYQPLIENFKQRTAAEVEKLQKWEYRVVSVRGSDPVSLTTALNRWGDEGWECFHVVSGAPSLPTGMPSEHLLFFRKRPRSWLMQVPLREVLKLLWYAIGESGGESAGP